MNALIPSKPIESQSSESGASQPSGAIQILKPSDFSKPHWNPHPYQERAIRLMLTQAAVGLFLDPGLGKTSIVLAAIKILLTKRLITRVLIVAPLRVAEHTWPSEMNKWEEFDSLTYAVIHGNHRNERLSLDVDIHLINPEGLPWLIENHGLNQYDVLVIDESSKFKDSQTKRFKSLKPWIPNFKRRWILTGTPVPNGLMDLFGQIYILDLGRSLGRFITHYRKEFFDPTGFGGYQWVQKPDAFPKIIERISPLLLRMSSAEFLEMPELINVTIPVPIPPEVIKIYRDVEEEFIAEVGTESIVAATGAVAGVKCRQIANGAVYINDEHDYVELHDAKIRALEDLLEELGGNPALILYEFEHDKERIKKALGPDTVPVLGSGLSESQLYTLIERFNAGNLATLLGHPSSMGHGLNLQGACHHIIWFGIPWNLEHYIQAIARVYRQGQKSQRVFVYHLVAELTVDVRVMNVLIEKDRDEQKVFQAISATRQDIAGALT